MYVLNIHVAMQFTTIIVNKIHKHTILCSILKDIYYVL